MVRPLLPSNNYLKSTGKKEGEYLTLTFFERDYGMEVKIAGWTKLRPQPGKPAYIKGIVNRGGQEIPVVDLNVLYGKGPTQMADSACIVILEGPGPHKYYFGILAEEMSSVINIADGTENKMSSLLSSAKRHLSNHPAEKN